MTSFEMILENLKTEYDYNISLENVYVNTKKKMIEITILLDNLIEVEDIMYITKYLYDSINLKQANSKNIIIKYKNIDYKPNMLRYWDEMLEKAIIKSPKLACLKEFKIEFLDGCYTIFIDKDSVYLEKSKNTISNEFNYYGLNPEIKFQVSEDVKSVDDMIQEFNNEQRERLLEDRNKQLENQEVKIEKKKYRNKYEPISISDIPVDQFTLSEYENTVGLANFKTSGFVFGIETQTTKNKSTIFTLKVTDNNDSILAKKFVSNSDELEELNKIKVGDYIEFSGTVKYDQYSKDIVFNFNELEKKPFSNENLRTDLAINKRVELHAHSKLSNMDAIATAEDYLKACQRFNHKAIAITDHDGCYSICDMVHSLDSFKGEWKDNFKPIYGAEFTLVDESKYDIAFTVDDIDLNNAKYVVFDIETTGFSVNYDKIIEIGAEKYYKNNQEEKFDRIINPHLILGEKTKELTNITQEMVDNGVEIEDALKDFLEFAKGSILVAHNATFDVGFMYEFFRKYNIDFKPFPVIDTMQLARALHGDKLKKANLDVLTKFYKVRLDNHHRADADTEATALIFMNMLKELNNRGITNYNQINSIIDNNEMLKHMFGSHFTVLAKNQIGYKNLFKITSDSLTKYFNKKAKIPKKALDQYRDGVLLGSSCVNGEVFEKALNKGEDELREAIRYYDYIEVQPPCVYKHLKEEFTCNKDVRIEDTIKRIIRVAKEENKIVVATGDCHYIEKEDKKYRDIYVRTKAVGGGLHPLAHYNETPDQHFFTTDEMLIEFDFLGADLAYEIVVKNTNMIADMIEPIVTFKKTLFSPADDEFKDSLGVPSIEEDLKRMVNEQVHEWYGEVLPKYVEERLEKELNSIISNKFSPIYYMAYLLVKKSNSDGYLVGSRGSVGSSFVATLMNITEVNPLSPHYRCPKCKFSSFKMNEEDQIKYGVREIEKPIQEVLSKYESGFDLPDMECPICKTKMIKDGQDIPFETFLGFKGDKTPDIDLNFSGDYQPTAHLYVRELMGNDNAFRAGTIATVAEKTAYGYVKGYLEDKNIKVRNVEIERLAKKIEGAKRSTGQHPGGIVVVPKAIDVYEVTPIQYPADDTEAEWRTTHFDYHSFEHNLLKLDILGHDDPTVIKFLMDYVHEHQDEFPFDDPRKIPIDDPKLYQLFCGTDIIGLKPEDIDSSVASYAVPELGTNFVRSMLEETKPSTFAGLVKISGLSHGTDVYTNNAQDLVLGKKPEFGTIAFDDVIGCRDDIMVTLMYLGIEPAKAFEIMEFVRKGKAAGNPEKWQGYKDYLKERNIPDWYIWSCGQIKYMFPKAHAVAYVLSAMRIAWFKIYKPILFYSAYFSTRADQFDPVVLCHGVNAIRNKIDEIKAKGYDASKTETDLLDVLYVALEMTKRGFEFKMVDVNKSEAKKFVVDGNSLLCPFITIPGLGESVANQIVEERNKSPFTTKNDFERRAKVSKTIYATLNELGAIKLDEEKEYNLFSMLGM